MKKRILSCFMALALCLTLLPATALAATPHTHPICGKTCSHTGSGMPHPDNAFETKLYSESGDYSWHTKKGMSDAANLELDTTNNQWKLPAGNYYLDGDTSNIYKTERTIKITGNVTICLNGKEIQKTKGDATPVFEVPSGFRLTLTDCKGTGKVTCGTTSIDSGSGVYVTGGTFDLYKGQITGNKGQEGENTDRYGGGVYVSGGTFNMYGGAITENTASYGGGVYVKSGTFNMNGGTITKNTSDRGSGNDSGGAGVYVEQNGNFIMNNAASVTENKIKRLSNGGGVYVNGGTFTMNGTSSVTNNIADYNSGTLNGGGVYVSGGNFEMNKNASVTGNKANRGTALNGAGVYVTGKSSKFEMNNSASVKDNTANQGGGVYVESGTFNMNDGTISGNTAKNDKTPSDTNGGGVYVNKSGTFNMTDGTITGNTATNTDKKNTTYGGGVYVSGGTFNMNGNATSVTGNTATNGGGVSVSSGKFNMNDGKISSNTGNGVFVNSGTFTVSNTPTVTGNTKGSTDSAASNVYLAGGAYITIDKKGLTDGASIGVTKKKEVDNGVIATGVNQDYSSKFFSDDNTYKVKYKNNQLVLERIAGTHTHIWSYQTKGDDSSTIYVSCTGDGNCEHKTKSASVKISMTQSTYPYSENMEAPTAKLTYSDNWPTDVAKAQESDITYCEFAASGDSTEISGAPTKVGKYMAKITVGGQTASVKYEIVSSTTGKQEQNTLYVTSDKEYLAVGETLTLSFKGGSGSGAVEYKVLGGGTGKAKIEGDVLTAEKAGTVKVTAVKKGDATFKDAVSEPLPITITEKTGGTTPSQPGGSSSGDSGSYDSNPIIKTETKNNPDGSTTKTETRKDGTVTQTTTGKDGSVSKTTTNPNGSSVTENKAVDGSTGTVKTGKNGQTEANAKVSDKAIENAKKNGKPVKAPVEVEAGRNSGTAPTVKVELPQNSGKTEVEIPVSNANAGTVAIIVRPDGTEEILKDSIPTKDGIRLTVDGSATVKIVDNAKNFIDTQNHWAKDEINFVSARELVNGISATRYAPDATATRAQLWTILARQNDADLSGGANWYEKAQLWSKDKGISDGTNPDATITRAQMVTMLWRTMGQPAATDKVSFADVPAGSYYAQAVAWAVESGITQGVGGDRFDPNATCTRAQIAAFLARSMK
ncbi:S-layer homology domain-containing protein [Intestinimonas sp. MSJ-38]|uniref:S-layer homology domain-containing protein n=1 Tax=Intestinimonas sp. MSJ-38 TaxID=2841532 RepID=UPI001C1066F0|nr:S-layer homology domain-containing protein [Intestinimonas sp. MSJ-38]MBU5433153.1 S-layer homology domain-containing protein [Intestinimonas sp. MSJ-38]